MAYARKEWGRLERSSHESGDETGTGIQKADLTSRFPPHRRIGQKRLTTPQNYRFCALLSQSFKCFGGRISQTHLHPRENGSLRLTFTPAKSGLSLRILPLPAQNPGFHTKIRVPHEKTRLNADPRPLRVPSAPHSAPRQDHRAGARPSLRRRVLREHLQGRALPTPAGHHRRRGRSESPFFAYNAKRPRPRPRH